MIETKIKIESKFRPRHPYSCAFSTTSQFFLHIWVRIALCSLLAPWKKSYDKPRQHIKKKRLHFADKGLYSQSYGFSSSHVWIWELAHKEGWALKNWCFWIVVLEKTPENPLDSKEFKQLILKEINTEYSLEGFMLELQYFGHLMWRADLLEKTLILGKIEGRRRRR